MVGQAGSSGTKGSTRRVRVLWRRRLMGGIGRESRHSSGPGAGRFSPGWGGGHYTECVRPFLAPAVVASAVLLALAALVPASAQDTGVTIVQPENVRMDF